MNLSLKRTALPLIQIHVLKSEWMANRNEDGALKDINIGGWDRNRESSQSFKYSERHCEDPELGLRSITADGTTVPETQPSRKHFTEIFEALSKGEEDTRLAQAVVDGVYENFFSKKNVEKNRVQKIEDLRKTLAFQAKKVEETTESLKTETDPKKVKKLEGEITRAQKAVQKAKDELYASGAEIEGGGEADAGEEDSAPCQTKQVLPLSEVETKFLGAIAAETYKRVKATPKPFDAVSDTVTKVKKEWEKKDGIEYGKLRLGAGIQAAVFGRPTWAGFQSSVSAVGVSHRYSVHAAQITYDTFTACDVKKRKDDGMGGGHLGELPLSQALLYGYMTVDVRQLVENVERESKDSPLCAEIIRRLVLMASRLSTDTKNGSLANKNTATLLIVEVGKEQPQSFMDAFLAPVTTDPEHPDMKVNAVNRLAEFIRDNDEAHPTTNKRAMMLVRPNSTIMPSVIQTVMNDLALAEWAVQAANGDKTVSANGKATTATAPAE